MVGRKLEREDPSPLGDADSPGSELRLAMMGLVESEAVSMAFFKSKTV